MIRLGILGGGQLAQMMTQAAVSLGIETAIFERKPDSPASRLTHHHLHGDWDDDALIAEFAAMCDVITLENEFVDASVLERLAAHDVPVYPTAATLARIQDKLVQKQTMDAAELPLPPYRGVDSPAEVEAVARDFGWPLVLKARREGYDGYGNATLNGPADVGPAFERLSAAKGELLVEAWVPFERELAVMVLRGQNGEILRYPVVETIQRDHICHVVRAPAGVLPGVAQHAAEVAERAVEAIDGVGVFGVELFELSDGTILYNEIAPRPHNSGHYTIEACRTSQFENHIRAVLGWPLGSTALVAPAAVMVNVLGSYQGDAAPDAARDALAIDGAHLHIYSKRDARPGRKMGHVTALAGSLKQAEAIARKAADRVAL